MSRRPGHLNSNSQRDSPTVLTVGETTNRSELDSLPGNAAPAEVPGQANAREESNADCRVGDAVVNIDAVSNGSKHSPEDEKDSWWRGFVEYLAEEYLSEDTGEPAPEDYRTNFYSQLCKDEREGSLCAKLVLKYFERSFNELSYIKDARDDVYLFNTATEEPGTPLIYNFKSRAQTKDFEAELHHLSNSDENTCLIVVPDLSPVALNLLGDYLGLDYKVFFSHLPYSQNGSRFEFLSEYLFNTSTNLDDVPNCITLDFHVNISTSQGQRAIESKSFLDARCLRWPGLYSAGYADLWRSNSKTTIACKRIGRVTAVLILLSQHNFHVDDSEGPFPGESNPIIRASLNSQKSLRSDLETEKIVKAFAQDIKNNVLLAACSPNDCFADLLIFLALRISSEVTHFVQRDEMILRGMLRNPDAAEEEFASAIAGLRNLEDQVLNRCEMLKKLKRHIERISQQRLDTLDSSCKKLAAGFGETACRKIRVALGDMDEVLSKIEAKVGRKIQDQQEQLTRIQIEESRRAIAQNYLVRKLTILAFFFIPVSAVSSIFGMNVRELIKDPPSVAIFGISVAAVTVGAMLLAISGPIFFVLFYWMEEIWLRVSLYYTQDGDTSLLRLQKAISRISLIMYDSLDFFLWVGTRTLNKVNYWRVQGQKRYHVAREMRAWRHNSKS